MCNRAANLCEYPTFSRIGLAFLPFSLFSVATRSRRRWRVHDDCRWYHKTLRCRTNRVSITFLSLQNTFTERAELLSRRIVSSNFFFNRSRLDTTFLVRAMTMLAITTTTDTYEMHKCMHLKWNTPGRGFVMRSAEGERKSKKETKWDGERLALNINRTDTVPWLHAEKIKYRKENEKRAKIARPNQT